MLRIKEEWIVKANKANVAFNIPRRKYNQPKRLGSPVCGRIPEGEAKYKSRYIQKMAVVVYKDGSERVELVCIRWQIISLYVRDRDGRCLKCGSTEELTGDHFYPLCYCFDREFFNPKRIQTLCKTCHASMPPMEVRKHNWHKYCFLSRQAVERLSSKGRDIRPLGNPPRGHIDQQMSLF